MNLQVREAETIRLKEALVWIKGLEIKICIFETDSRLLVEGSARTLILSHNRRTEHSVGPDRTE